MASDVEEAVLDEDLVEAKDACLEELGWTYESFEVSDDVTALHFPFAHIPKSEKHQARQGSL